MHSPPLVPATAAGASVVAGGLVLVAPGVTLAGSDGAHIASRLAALLGLRLLTEQDLRSTLAQVEGDPFVADPPVLLAGLMSLQPGWLLPLPLDPGADLARSGCWSDALAAWRQPVLLLLPAQNPAQASGLPRAYTALLQTAGVPLLGLVQIGGCWDPDARRHDGLPWLGCLPAEPPVNAARQLLEDDEACQALRQTSLRRWRALVPQAALQRGQA